MKRRFLLIPIAGLFLAACSSEPAPPPAEEAPAASLPADQPPQPTGTPVIVMETDKGELEFELLTETAPKTAAHFQRLAERGFYYNTSFHRVMKGTMVQGGDPLSKDHDPYNDGQGGSGETIEAEFSEHKFDRGTVAMARQPNDPNSASSQFFIVLKRMPSWDGEYTAFGKVSKGIEVADQISQAPLSKEAQLRDRPVANIRIKNVRVDYRQP